MKYLDPHISIMMIDFIADKKLYPEVELMYAKMKLLMKTFCVEKAEQTLAKLKELNADKAMIEQVEQEFTTMKKKYEEEKTTVESLWETQKELLDNEEFMGVINGTRKLAESTPAEDGSADEEVGVDGKTLTKTFGVNAISLNTLYRYARFMYRTGAYETAFGLLQKFFAISNFFKDEISAIKGKALWSKLACDIMLNRSDDGFADIESVRSYIDSLVSQMHDNPRSVSHLQLLHMRVWLMHWSLFIYMRAPDHLQEGKDKVANLFQYTQYMNALQTEAPHLIRYLVVAFVTNKRKQHFNKTLVRYVQQVSYMYTDSLTSFIDRMYETDFDGALAALTECREKLFPNDIVVQSFQDEFVHCARLFLFNNFVLVHHRVDVPTLANKLCLSEKEVEQWVVDLIRNNSRLDARIDSAANQMIFGTKQIFYQNILDDTTTIREEATALSRYIEEYEENGSIPSAGVGRYRR